jgi:hypothetical protein
LAGTSAANAVAAVGQTASGGSPLPDKIAEALARFRETIPPNFDSTYVENFDIYWDLHLGVKGEAIPKQVRQIGEAFNTVLAYRNPLLPIVYENYMTVRNRLDFLKQWIDERVEDITNGRTANPEKTMVWYWLKNAGDGKNFSKKDIVFECFHNFVAFSQWGNTIFGVMSRLSENGERNQQFDSLTVDS